MQYRKLPKRININKVFIAPAMITMDEKDKCGHYLNRPVMKIVCVNQRGHEYELVDLETRILCVDEDSIENREAGLIFVSSNKLVPLNSFVSKKYKDKSLPKDKILEIGKFVIRNSNDVNISTILNFINFNRLYVVKVYNNRGNVIKKKAVAYKVGNQFIDVDSKEIYLLDEGIIDINIESDLKIVKPDELLLMNDYMRMAEIDKKINIKRRNYE